MGISIPPPKLDLFLNYLLVGISFNAETISTISSSISITSEPLTGACNGNPIVYEFNYQVYISNLSNYYPAPTFYADFNARPCQ
ncbi:hypothetical protein [Vulcanisaeta souniana]|uniref:hypothetical protein n=1 Tax=Vulcanisaeta souniana TaxID=164452 RepID=UPI001FB40FE6|nr:hypothetical protein [Vulcanisaeta souniana]